MLDEQVIAMQRLKGESGNRVFWKSVGAEGSGEVGNGWCDLKVGSEWAGQ